jgi:3-hydroxybutyryl-CoA dehydrogenase
MMKKTKSMLPLDDVLKRIKPTTDYKDFQKGDILIENITEDYEAKKKLYLELREVCSETVIYGVNTSCISIT